MAVVLVFAGASVLAQAPLSNVVATTVPVSLPGQLAYDASGNLYIAATNDHVIRKVDTKGIMTTVAGTGDQGFAGDGGPATAAMLDSPAGVALDSSNNIYIADTHNNRIREVLASTGVITTIAGTGAADFGGDGAAATSALLNYPTAVALDSANNLYIADTNNHRIRKITGTTISTVAGNGDQSYEGDGVSATATGLDSPNGVAVDGSLNMYIGDTHNQRVRLVTAATGIITTFAGTGVKTFTADNVAANAAALARPRGVVVSPNGSILIADSDNDRIRAVSSGTIQTVVGGEGIQGFSGDNAQSLPAEIDTPRGVAATAQNNVVFSDTENYRVREVNSAGIIETIAGIAPQGDESLTLTGAATSVVYGTGSLVATFSFNDDTAAGDVTFYNVTSGTPVPIGSPVPLASNLATLSTTTLPVGTYLIEAVYPGDGSIAAATSGVYVLTVTPLAISATVQSLTIEYGQPIPTLSGTLNGVLAQDSGMVNAVYSTTAAALSPPGVYPISVALTGPAAGNYTVTIAPAANLTITKASSLTVLTSSTATPVPGGAVTLTATVTSTTTGVPTGGVLFYYGTAPNQVLLNAAPVVLSGAGVAQLTTSALPAGVFSVTAVYSGDVDFTTSTSNSVTETVAAGAPFTFVLVPTAANPATQTVAPGGTATYNYMVSPGLATFPFPVTFTVTGVPPGATYTLTPFSVNAGAGSTPQTLVVKTNNPLAQLQRTPERWLAVSVGLFLLPFAGFRRTRETLPGKRSRGWLLSLLLISAGLIGTLAGCGAGGFFGTSPQTYTITVTATSGGVSQSQSVTLVVQ